MYGSTSGENFQNLDLSDDQPAPSLKRKWMRRRHLKIMSSRVILIVGMCVCVGTIVYQRITIQQLQNQMVQPSSRGKRALVDASENDVDEKNLFLPVYAQISKRAMKRLCEKHRFYLGDKFQLKPIDKSGRRKAEIERKRCSSDFTFGQRKLISKRPNKVGSAVKDGDRWFLTEFHLGYTILEFTNDSTLAGSLPSRIATLPYPFHGTDGTVHNRTNVYMFGETVIAYNLATKATRHHAINASLEPLYRSSNSRIDAQADEHGLWVLYREKGEDHLTAVRLHLKNLKEINRWTLYSIKADGWCNAFIRCGVLYSVECPNGTIVARPVYDFYSNAQISGREEKWKGDGHLSNVQYDPNSKTLNMFDYGNVYSIELHDKLLIV